MRLLYDHVSNLVFSPRTRRGQNRIETVCIRTRSFSKTRLYWTLAVGREYSVCLLPGLVPNSSSVSTNQMSSTKLSILSGSRLNLFYSLVTMCVVFLTNVVM